MSKEAVSKETMCKQITFEGLSEDNIGAERLYLSHGFRKTDAMEGNDYYYLRHPNEDTI